MKGCLHVSIPAGLGEAGGSRIAKNRHFIAKLTSTEGIRGFGIA